MTAVIEEEAIEKLAAFAKRCGRENKQLRAKLFTLEEFQEVKSIMEEGRQFFIFEPYGEANVEFGLNVYRYPPYPGTPPVFLAVISGLALPEELRIEEKVMRARILDDGFRELSPFSHTPENTELLVKHALKRPHSVDAYGY